jgi:hypothetical protein
LIGDHFPFPNPFIVFHSEFVYSLDHQVVKGLVSPTGKSAVQVVLDEETSSQLEGFDSVIGLQVYMAADKNGGAASTVL